MIVALLNKLSCFPAVDLMIVMMTNTIYLEGTKGHTKYD